LIYFIFLNTKKQPHGNPSKKKKKHRQGVKKIHQELALHFTKYNTNRMLYCLQVNQILLFVKN
jgi:hypothetical protein